MVLAAGGLTAACRHHGFQLTDYPSSPVLYDAALREYQRGHWANAIAAFDKLTTDLGARDTLLPRSYWYLGHAHEKESENLLAAQSYTRLYESFPDDSLADDAMLAAGFAYKKLWRKPALDATYGETALTTLTSMLELYPTSEHLDEARRAIAQLEESFAVKNYETGMFYFRQKGYDSAIIYFRYVMDRWPNAPHARDALLRLAEAFRAIHYREDYAESCARLRQSYPADREVRDVCAGAPTPRDSASTARPGAP